MNTFLAKSCLLLLLSCAVNAIPTPLPAGADLDGRDVNEPSSHTTSNLRPRGSVDPTTGCFVESAADVLAEDNEEAYELAVSSDPNYADAFKLRTRQTGQYWQCVNINGNGVQLSYDVDYLDAVSQGWYALITGATYANRRADGTITSSYPKRFWNFENLQAPLLECPGEELYEFPVFPGTGNVPLTYTGGSPGPDRVLFSQCGNPCGVITHRGLVKNAFHTCTLV